MYMYAPLCAWCPGRPEEGTGSPGTGVMDNCSSHVSAENQIRSSAKVASVLNHSSLYSPERNKILHKANEKVSQSEDYGHLGGNFIQRLTF